MYFSPIETFNTKLLPWLNQSCYKVFDAVEMTDCMHVFGAFCHLSEGLHEYSEYLTFLLYFYQIYLFF